MDAGGKSSVVGRGMVGFGGDGADPRLPVPPTQARGAEKRERLYRAAIARFREVGVADTRVEDVIADAGVSWATFFRYFPRKEDVLIEAAARHFRERVVPVAERGIADRRTKVRRVTERVFATLLEPAELTPRLHTQAFLEVINHPARFAAMVGGGDPAPFVGMVHELLAEGQRRGEVDPGLNAGAAALTVAAGAMFPAVQTAAAGGDAAQSMALALEVLWGGLGPR
jgi:AcrR family transcriptional regulator